MTARVRGGMPVGPDGRVHTVWTHNPSTLRLSSQRPNLQNLPRGHDELARLVKAMFVAGPGRLFWARDFSGIEAVLVGYFAGSRHYIRLARLGVHAYVCLALQGRAPSLERPDAELRGLFREAKQAHPVLYDQAKRCVHLSNYRGTPRRMHLEYPETFPTVRDAARLQGFYFELFPEIPRWHAALCLRVDATRRTDWQPPAGAAGNSYLRNPFGYVHRFWRVLRWRKQGLGWTWDYAEDAKRAIAFLPQSTAAGLIKEAALALWAWPVPLDQALAEWEALDLDRRPYGIVGASLRLTVHDEILGEVSEAHVEECVRASRAVMEAPSPWLPLDPSYGLGTHLAIGTEAKVGPSWGAMRPVEEEEAPRS